MTYSTRNGSRGLRILRVLVLTARMWRSGRSQIVAVNDNFSGITGYSVNFSGLDVFWGKSTDKAGFPVFPDRSSVHLMFIPWRPLSRVLTFPDSCVQAQLNKLELYMSRSIDGGYER